MCCCNKPFGYDADGNLLSKEELELEAKDWALDDDIHCHGVWDDYKIFDRVGNDVSHLFTLELREAIFRWKLSMEK